MKRKEITNPEQDQDDLRPEYQFDYRKARPNRFAGRSRENRVIVLDPDIAQVFTTSEAVNNILRALIHTMPPIDKDADVEAG